MKIPVESSSMRHRPQTALAVAAFALLLPYPAAAAGLKLKRNPAWTAMHPIPAPAAAPVPAPVYVLAPAPFPAGPAPSVVDAVHLEYTFSALNYTKVQQNSTLKGELVNAIQEGVLGGIANKTLPPPQEGLVLAQQAPLCPCPREMGSGLKLVQQVPPAPTPAQPGYCPCMPASPYPAPGPAPAPYVAASTNDYTKADVAVVLKPGSIIADVTLYPHEGTHATQLFAVLDLAVQKKIEKSVLANVMALQNIGALLEFCKRLKDIKLTASIPQVIDSWAPKSPIRPGVVVQITNSKEQLLTDFKGLEIHYDPLMDDMLGKTFVVKEMNYGGAGMPSPTGSQADTWYFPLNSLTPWLDTPAGKAPPVAGKAMRSVGGSTNPRVEILPPGRNEAPWHYHIAQRGLLDPIAPPYNERVDLKATKMEFPPWKKVQQVISVECMEKMHKDPTVLCEPEDYINYARVKSTPPPPPTKEEVEALKKKIKHLKGTIKSMSPEVNKTKVPNKVPGTETHPVSMNAAGAVGNEPPVHTDNADMNVMKEGTEARLNTANGQWRNLPEPEKANRKMAGFHQ